MARPDSSVRIHSLQPLFVSGQCLTDAKERRLIVRLLRDVESDLGWATGYRVKQLLKEWGWNDEVGVSWAFYPIFFHSLLGPKRVETLTGGCSPRAVKPIKTLAEVLDCTSRRVEHLATRGVPYSRHAPAPYLAACSGLFWAEREHRFGVSRSEQEHDAV